MSYALPSAEVAADFRDALQDLKINSRPEISNLTVIAKENTEHAQAISRELEEHIRKTRPEWKLPALYVLDSIVKNVGTPYTVYLGRNLYSVFMSAYTLVDSQTRKAMEALLKTWKQPVPESLDTRPVIDPSITREIENALIKVRTLTLQHQQQARPQQQPALPRPAQAGQWRNTPTPPQTGYQPPAQAVPHFNPSVSHPPTVPSPLRQYATPVTPSNAASFPQVQPQYPPPNTAPPDLGKVQEDVRQLIVSASMDLASNPQNTAQTQVLLKSLVDLQKILSAGNLPPPAIQSIANEVTRISGAFKPAAAPAPRVPIPSQQSTPQPVQAAQPAALAALFQSLTPQVSTPTMPPAPHPPTATSTPPPIPASNQISQLLAALAPKPTPPPPIPSAPPQNDLFATLRAAGLIPGTGTPMPTAPENRVKSPVQLLQALAGPPLRMDTASLKIPRPYLVSKLYEARPDQCRQCGRRFPATEEGKKQKAAHMDWHFSINTRIAEAVKGVVNRSWYIGEMEWIKYRETDESTSGSSGNGANSTTNSANTSPTKKQPKESVVPVPTEISKQGLSCPICQEKFDVSWHEETQTPVWTNAIKVGERVYHKTCYDEVYKATAPAMSTVMGAAKGGGSARSTPTPESVLGKRKYEIET